MSRELDVVTLDGAADYLAGQFYVNRPPFDREFVINELYKYSFKDEYEYVLAAVRKKIAGDVLALFDDGVKQVHDPRDDKVFAKLLREKLAIDPNGKHLDGAIGTTQMGMRVVGKRPHTLQTSRGTYALVKNVYWPIYAGESEERLAGRIRKEIGEGKGADPLPDTTEGLPVGATNPNLSAAAAIALADQVTTQIDIGSTAAAIDGRSGAQPADPDVAATGTLLFTLTMSDPSFGAASDAAPGGQISASAITDDTSADATATLGYCRVRATGTGADDVLDGEAGTSASDFNFNTLSIVAGSTVSMTSMTITVPQGSTAT